MHCVVWLAEQAGWLGAQTPVLQVALAASQYWLAVQAVTALEDKPSAAHVRTPPSAQNDFPGSHWCTTQAPSAQVWLAVQNAPST